MVEEGQRYGNSSLCAHPEIWGRVEIATRREVDVRNRLCFRQRQTPLFGLQILRRLEQIAIRLRSLLSYRLKSWGWRNVSQLPSQRLRRFKTSIQQCGKRHVGSPLGLCSRF